MKIIVNDKAHDLAVKFLVELTENLNVNPKGTAVAVNGIVIPKQDWESLQLFENDKVMIIRATQGG